MWCCGSTAPDKPIHMLLHVPCYGVRMSDGFAAMIPARRCFVEVQTSSFSAVVVRDAINRHSYLGTKDNHVDCSDEERNNGSSGGCSL